MHKFFYLFPYLFLPYMFRAIFKPTFKCHSVQIRQWFLSPGYGVSVRARFGPDPDADTVPRRIETLRNLYTVPL
jgi:hypothetical protein